MATRLVLGQKTLGSTPSRTTSKTTLITLDKIKQFEMLGLRYNHRCIQWGIFFLTLLTAHNISLAKNANKKSKPCAVVSPTIEKKHADSDGAGQPSKANLQTELETENALNRARLEKKLSNIIAQVEQLRLEKERQRLDKEIDDEQMRKEHSKAMVLLNMEKEKLVIELELAQARFMKQMEQYNTNLIELDKKVQLEKGQAQLMQEMTHRLQTEIEALQTKIARDKHIQKKPLYLKDPLIKQSNTLVLSDRCIDLNGCITPWKANYIVDQIHYFNNKNSDYPIFLIINASPGGYVNAGWNILQAIEYSKAPVYVVVKTYAASMAALITTLATKSCAYPNAQILHHQPTTCWWKCSNNVRETKERYAYINEIWKRLGGRVAKKMGISLKEFDKKLYEKSIYGDWREYGNNAKKLKWVDYVINSIQHSGISSLPNEADYTFEQFIKQYYDSDKMKEEKQYTAEKYYHTLAPHDFDYSYSSEQKAQMMGKQ